MALVEYARRKEHKGVCYALTCIHHVLKPDGDNTHERDDDGDDDYDDDIVHDGQAGSRWMQEKEW